MNILTEYYEWFVLQTEPVPIIHKNREESRKSTSTLSNFMNQFRYKEMGLRNTLKSVAELQRSAEHSLNKTAIKQNCLPGHKTSLMTRHLYGLLH